MGRLRTPRVSQPQGPTGIDWGNPITRGLVTATLPGMCQSAGAITPTPQYQAGVKQSVSRLGAVARTVANYGVSLGDQPKFNFGTQDFTIFCVVSPVARTGTQVAVGRYNATSGSYWLGYTGGAVAFSVSGVNASCTAPAGVTDTLCGVRSAGSITAYANGVSGSAVAAAGSVTATGILAIGVFGSYNSYDCVGDYALTAIWDRALSKTEILALSLNPWQIFAPDARNIWVPVAAGGPVTHATTGALTGQLGSIAGTAAHVAVHGTSGTPTGQLGSVAGSAARLRAFASTGALTGQGSAIVGSATRAGGTTTHDATGTPTGQGSAVVGTAAHVAIHGTSGTLVGTSALLAGTAVHSIPHGTSGDLTGPGSVVVGSALNGLASVTKSGVNRLWLIDYYTKEFAAKEKLRNPEPAKTRVVAKKRAAEVAAKVEASVAKAEKDLATLTKSMKDVQDAQVFIYNAIQQAKQAPQAESVDFMAVAKRYEKKMQQEEHELLLLAMVL